jgi:hypothetical protein
MHIQGEPQGKLRLAGEFRSQVAIPIYIIVIRAALDLPEWIERLGVVFGWCPDQTDFSRGEILNPKPLLSNLLCRGLGHKGVLLGIFASVSETGSSAA